MIRQKLLEKRRNDPKQYEKGRMRLKFTLNSILYLVYEYFEAYIESMWMHPLYSAYQQIDRVRIIFLEKMN